MKILLEILQYFGVENVNVENEPLIVFSFCIMFLSIMGLLSFLNILIYFSVVYFFIINEKVILEKLNRPQKIWRIIKKIILFYKETRIYFIIFEILMFIWVMGVLIWVSSRVFFGLI